jgi:dihydrofolate synthase / folylpolyglutamate synthase
VTYEEAFEYMLSHLPMFSRIGPAAFKKDLSNTIQLCEHLGNPQTKLKCIHIAGTNGKGSVSHILASALQACGYKTGLYTSPHYKDYRERIKINGSLIPKRYVSSFIQKHRPFLDELQPSYFEMSVGMAFSYFADSQCDYVVIETGLGGRLDSTNIINPLLSIITNISFDHMDMLGDTLDAIAFEKAGIIKHDRPVLIGERQEEISFVFKDKARWEQAPLFFADEWVRVVSRQKSPQGMSLSVELLHEGKRIQTDTDLYGDFQLRNITTAVAGWILLNKFHGIPFDPMLLSEALHNVRQRSYFLGRMHWLSTSPMILADSAHNEAGISVLLNEVNQLSYKTLHIVLGTVSDKSPDKVLSLLPEDAVYYFVKASIPRAMDAKTLAEKAEKYHLKGKNFSSVSEGYRTANAAMGHNDFLLICGSIFVVAEVL